MYEKRKQARLQIGCEFFREIRELDLWYVDKTGFIEEFLSPSFSKFSIITRPRRFGKTLMLTMLRDFFDIRQNSKALFEGLAISKNKDLCDKWMNQYPAVFVTFHGIQGLSFEEALGKVRSCMSDICIDYSFLLDSTSVDEKVRDRLAILKAEQCDESMLSDSLSILCHALHEHYGRPAILLIDEYDVPLAKAQEYGYYPEMVQFYRRLLSTVLKTSSLKFAILAGCLKISGECLFEGHSDYAFYDVSEARFADKIGFTSEEVDDLLAAFGCTARKGEIEEWYDGYRFGGDAKICCPWDILQYVDDLLANDTASPKSYWGLTSRNEIVGAIAEFSGTEEVRIKLDTLMTGGCIAVRLAENLAHDRLYENAENIWTVLYLSGYLTRAGQAQIKKCGIKPGAGETALAIPNREVLGVYADALSDWFDKTVRGIDRTDLFNAIQANDADGVAEFLCSRLNETISWYDAREDYYLDFVKGMFTGWDFESNSCYINKPDIVLRDKKNRRAAIIEVRRTKSKRGLAGMAEKALLRIKKKHYAASLLERDWKFSIWAMAFFKKDCAVRAETAELQP